jgi:hypothetical protein
MLERDLSKVPKEFIQAYIDAKELVPDLFINRDVEKEAEEDWAILSDETKKEFLGWFLLTALTRR